jgi:hypothetical protein
MSEKDDDKQLPDLPVTETTLRVSRAVYARIKALRNQLLNRAVQLEIPIRGIALGAVVETAVDALEQSLEERDGLPRRIAKAGSKEPKEPKKVEHDK